MAIPAKGMKIVRNHLAAAGSRVQAFGSSMSRQLARFLFSAKTGGAITPFPNAGAWLSCWLVCIFSLGHPGHAAAKARPNLLWLIGEDLGPELGCYRTREVRTPNLDRLAAEGVRYTRFYSGHVCSPSRSAFMTGMYATTIGAHHHRSHRQDGFQLPEGVRLLTDWMRDTGYYTANVVELPAGCGFKGTGKTDWNFNYAGKPFDSARWADLKTHQPFYAQINFSEAHRSFNSPAQADPAAVEIPPYYPDHPVVRRDWAQYLDAISELDRKIGRVLETLKRDGLAEDTVVIFFGDNGQSHVRGKQFCYEEGLHVPLLIRWPRNFPQPAHFQAGTVDDRLLHAIDLAPTMLSLVGAIKPPRMQGRIFLGPACEPAREYVFGARDRCDETAMRIRTVRDERYRYIRNFTPEIPWLAKNAYKEKQYPVWNLLKDLHAQGRLTPVQAALCQPRLPQEELYDLATDPFEIQNLARSSDPAPPAALQKLRAVLDRWIEETNDQGRFPEAKNGDPP
jgi:arylsulfatase A-like enzyme